MRLLVVDDDPAIRLLFRIVFPEPSALLRATDTAGEALRMLREWPPDVLVTDLHLPDGKGEEVATRASQLEPAPTIILMSGDSGRLHRARSLAFLALEKPFSVARIRAAVAEAAAVRSAPAPTTLLSSAR